MVAMGVCERRVDWVLSQKLDAEKENCMGLVLSQNLDAEKESCMGV